MPRPLSKSQLSTIDKATDRFWRIAVQTRGKSHVKRFNGHQFSLSLWERNYKTAVRNTLTNFLESF